jgi:site-specific DNA-methyltransferase (adenine-specific)
MTLTLHHGDCLELMKTLPDKSIDLFLCDLPYGCLTGGKEKARRLNNKGEKRTNNSGGVFGCGWDIPIDLAAFWVQVKRLCKNDHTPVLMFCTTKFGVDLIKSNEDWFRYDLVWSKGCGTGFLMANKMPMRSHEMIYVFSKKGATYTRVNIQGNFPPTNWNKTKKLIPTNTYNGGTPMPNDTTHNTTERCVTSVVEIRNNKGKGKHPTQKPDDLYEWLITRYSKEGDTILDPTAGSFASCFTAQRLGRNAIGMEMDEGFYNKANAVVR